MGAANCAGPRGLLEMWFTACCLPAPAMCCSSGGIAGIEFVLDIVLETLAIPWRACKLDQTADGCCQLSPLCENEGHRCPGRALWVLRGCLGTTSLLRPVRVQGKKTGKQLKVKSFLCFLHLKP